MSDIVKKTIKIEEVVDVRQVIRGIDEIKENLSKLSLGPGLQSEFDRVFQKIERNTEKANKAMASGFKNKGDVKAYEEAMRQISSAYDQIITKVKVLNSNKEINLQIDDAQVKNLNDEIENIKSNLNDLKNHATKAGKNLGKAITTGANHNKGGASYWNDAIKAFEDGKIDETEKAVKKLEGTIKAAQTRAKGAPLSDEWQQKADDVKALREALDKYKTAQQDVATEDSNLIAKKKELSDVMSKGAALLNETANIGKEGAEAFNQYAKESSQAAQSTQQLNSELEHFKGKAAYFFGLSNAINLFKRSLRSAYETVKDLDAVMTETAVVTNFDVGDMWDQLPEYTQRANELGVSIHSAYEAATIFYQQGLKTNEVMAVSNETLKMARIAGLDAATASDRMTNALRGFNMEMDKVSAQRVNDVYSKLAAITASNTDEISTAMTKVASLAHNANMEFETTSAFLAQMIETTRESAETAGTALKTVVARFSEVKKLYSKGELLGQDEEGGEIDVNKVSTALRSAGINLNEYLTGAKGLDDIFIELASKWDSLDKVQQRYIATMAAGSRQQSRFIAMMSDYGRTVELVDAANNANGASQEQYAKTLESLQTKLSRLKNAWDEFILGLANSDVIKGAVDALTDLITAINTLIKGISKGNASVKMITTFFTAFTGFKIGQKAFGGTQVGKFFSGLTQIAGTQGKAGAVEFTKNFYSKLSDKIANYGDKGGFAAKIKDQFSDIYGGLSQYLNPARNRKVAGLAKGSSKEEFLTGVVNKFSSDVSNEGIASFREKVGTQLEEGTLTLDSLNDALDKSGQKFKITEKNAKDFGIVLDKDDGVIQKSTVSMRQLSAVTAGVGAIMVGVGSALEATEGPFKELGTVLKVAGTGLVTFGTIMSVYLPLQAQLMAKGVTGAIVSIPIIGWIAGVISALVALGVALHSFSKNYSFEARMNKANEACKNAADAADEATKAYEKLGQAWDNLNDKYASIDKAVAGTQQWRDSIREANNEVLNLVGTYEGLETKIGEDGRLIITEESKQNVKDKLGRDQEMAQAASIGAQLNKNRIVDEEARRGYDSWNILGGYIDEEWVGANGEKYTEDKVREEIVKAYREGKVKDTSQLRELVASYLPQEMKGATDLINDYKFNGLKEYAQTSQFSDASRAQFSGLVSNALTGMRDQDSVKFAKNLLNTNFTEKLYKDQLKEVGKMQESDKQREYAKRAGYDTYEDWKQNVNNGKDISEEQLNAGLAAQNVQNQLKNFATQFENSLGNLTAEQLKYFQQENGGALTAKELKDIESQGGAAALANRLGDDEYFKNAGIDKAKFIEDLQKSLNHASEYAGKEIEGLSKDLTDNLSASAAENLEKNLKSVFTASGGKGYKEVTEQIEKITKGMDPKNAEGFANALSQVDWESTNSIRDLSDLAKEYGASEDAVNDLEKKIIKFNNSTTKVDLTKVTEQIKSLLSLSKKIQTGAQGRNFSEEQKNQLVEIGMDADKFVYNIETGEYNYTGVLNDIRTLVGQLVSKTFDVDQLEKDIASGKVAKNLMSKEDVDYKKDKSDFVSTYIDLAKENSKISKEAYIAAFNQAQLGDYTSMDELYNIIKQDANNLGDNEAKLTTYASNREIMSRQLNSGSLNAYDAIRGDKEALEALKSQLVSSGLPEELRQQLLTGMSPDSGKFQQSTTAAGNIADTFSKAQGFGINSEELNAYVNSLRQLENLQDTEIDKLYQLGLAEMNYQKGQQSLYDSYDEWSKLIQKDGGIVPDGSIEQGRVFNKLNEDLKQMLNLSEKLPDDFLKSKDNVDLLKKAIKGDKDAVEKLRTAAAKVQLGKIDIKDKDLKNNITNKIDELSKKMPDLKIGATLDSTEAGKGLMDFVNKAGMSVEDIQKLFNSLGWAPEIKWLDLSYTDATKAAQSGTVYQRNPDGSYEPVKLDGEETLDASHSYSIPQIGPKTSKVASKPPKKNPPKKKSKGKGGGKKSKAKKERWENPYDELYNLQEKINEALRKREALERRYQKLLKQQQTSLKDIRAAYYDQIKHMKTEANLQKQLAEGRLNQINKLGKDTYVTSKGKVKTFEQMGVTKYAKYNQETGEIQIDWAGINKLEGTKHVETGKAVEAYISKLEELVKGYEDTRDALWDIEDKIEELRQQVIETYLTFEDRVLDALVTRYQRQIDSYQAMSDAIDKINNEVLKSLREQVELSRQIRDNTKKEEDISKKENRLAYLRRDTSGANDLEILSLEKELKEAREGYSDTLVDQTIDKLQKDVDQASEQRERQIEVMQAQLDIMQKTGGLWDEAHKLLREANEQLQDLNSDEEFAKKFKATDLAKLLAKSEDISSLSDAGFLNWLDKVLTDYRQAGLGKEELEKKYGIDVDKDGKIDTTEPEEPMVESSVTEDFGNRDERNNGIAIGAKLGGYGWSSNATQLENQLKDKGFNENDIREILMIFKAFNKKDTTWKKIWPNLKLSNYSIDKFARGGLADYTGPAWLDGTKTNPELVLNAQDTRNFIALKDILSSLMSTQGASTKTSSGDNYFDINITADIGSDYDVDKLANRIKKQIFEDSQYRNVNTINYLR